VWWQALSGAVQLAFVVMAASTGVVRSPYALYAWSIIIHSLIQIPGFYQVMRNTLNAFQRNDYARYMDTAYSIARRRLYSRCCANCSSVGASKPSDWRAWWCDAWRGSLRAELLMFLLAVSSTAHWL
jgi:hypothetical protein